MTASLRKRWRFFLENAGYCTPPGRAVCALGLARAEQWRKDNETAFPELDRDGEDAGEVRIRWEPDPDPIRYADEDEDYQQWVCTVEIWTGEKWEIFACLGSVDSGPGTVYARIVEAELSAEAMAEFATVAS